MVRNLGLMLVVLCIAALPAAAQESAESHPEVVNHGGMLGGWVTLANMQGLNDLLSANGYAPFPQGFLVFGGRGVAGEAQGLRLGGGGAGGDVSSYQGERVAKLEFGYGGFTIDQGLLHGDHYDVAAGATLGGGEATLTLQAHRPDSFEEAIANPVNTVLTRGFWLVQPHLSISVDVLPWLSLMLNATYLWTLPQAWVQHDTVLPGPPADFNGWSVEVGLSFGGAFED
ncbi:MAG TPA: hypothetical protein VIL47_01365 [Candidatus Bipolaricaulota bacterium]